MGKDNTTGRTADLVRRILVERFPQTFKPRGAPKPPLKIGIADDVMRAMPELSSKIVRIALADYTWGSTYCEQVVEGAMRIDLDGNPCGAVSKSEEEFAKRRLALFARAAIKNRHIEQHDES